MFAYKKEKQLPIKSWIPEENYFNDEDMVSQVENLASLPFSFHHIAQMPDGHLGYGMPIGGVLATKNVIIPNAVGVDIGCGMCAVKTSLTDIKTETLKKIIGEIRKVIPVGFNKHKKIQDENLMPYQNDIRGYKPEKGVTSLKDNWENALKSIGTLGGGNHFIEIQKGSDGYIWIMIHSGSRNLGLKVANYYNDLAKKLNKKWFSSVDEKLGLAFLPVDSEDGQNYIKEMQYCVDFAFANRKLMMEMVKECFRKNKDASFDEIINIAHNYAKLENHFGENVWVHRKGATLATENTIGIIPGSQGTKSYIVKGKGNKESFHSCSHGAGRKLGRRQAERELNLEEEIKKLNDLGIIHGVRGKKDLDEAPGAYKSIDEVMQNQKDLVDIEIELTPLGVVKG